MRWQFTCPSCKTAFMVDVARDVKAVICPTCRARIAVDLRPEAQPGSTAFEPQTGTTYGEPKEGTWIIRAAAAFAALWAIVIIVMVIAFKKPAAPQASVAPPPLPPATAPAHRPLFEVDSGGSAPPGAAPPKAPASAPPPPPAASTQPATPPPPELRIVPKAAALTDADVVDSLHKGIGFLLTQFDAEGEVRPTSENAEPVEHYGTNALAVYALLHCSQSIRDDRINLSNPLMHKMIERMKAQPINATVNLAVPVTYARSLRASALSVFNRQEDQAALRADAQWLIAAANDGAYAYDDVWYPEGHPPEKPLGRPGVHEPIPFRFDNSNSQYGLFGVWSAAETGIVVPSKYWQDVEQHWSKCQNADGTWTYNSPSGPGPGSFTMTCAGITSLSVCRDYLQLAGETDAVIATDHAPYSPALQKAIDWLEAGDNAMGSPGDTNFSYALYGLERAALASGMSYAGKHDIYREMATRVVPSQQKDGSWNGARGPVIDTAFHLLFLARGRNAVMMNKLRYASNGWNNHPRDLASLTRYSSYQMERPVNWQVVTLNQPWSAWMDAPVLFISGFDKPPLKESDYDKLRTYAENGGLIFTHADGGSEAFNQFAEELARKLFPSYEMQDLSGDDDLYSIQFPIPPQQRPRFRALGNGSRRLMIHSPQDLAGLWESKDRRKAATASQVATNLFVYATGKSEPRPRLDSPYIPPPPNDPARRIPIAIVKYSGNWNPEPAAWPRFVRYFWWETGWELQPAPHVATELKYPDIPVAALTGTTPDSPTDADVQALRDYVNAGGTLIIDACGGSPRFADTIAKRWLPAIFPGQVPRVLADDDPIMTGKIPAYEKAAGDLTKPMIRRYTAQVVKPPNTKLLELKFGKGRVIYSELDITTGLLGTNTWGVNGYAPGYAQALLKNILLSATKPQ